MPKPLVWYKREGSVATLMNRKGAIGERFKIICKKGVYSLQDNEHNHDIVFRGTKPECKDFAQQLVNKEHFERVTPIVTSLWWYYCPDFHICHPKRKTLLKQAGLDLDDVTPSVARHAAHECNRLLSLGKRPKKLREVTVPTWKYHSPQEASDKKVQKAFAQNRVESIPKESKPPTLPEPEERDQKGLYRIYAPVFDPPFPLDNAKWRVLLKWCEKLRDFYQMRGIYLTPQALGNLAWRSFPKNNDRGMKACARVFLIYGEELEKERERTRQMIEKAQLAREEEQKERKGLKPVKDRWGFRTGSAAAKVNEVITKEPKTLKRISFECDVSVARVRTHLAALIKAKKVKKVEGNKYRERKVKK